MSGIERAIKGLMVAALAVEMMRERYEDHAYEQRGSVGEGLGLYAGSSFLFTDGSMDTILDEAHAAADCIMDTINDDDHDDAVVNK